MDYYSILEIPKSASAEEIKKAYRKMAMKHHPDRNGGDDTQFKKIQEAYEILSDPNKKQQYDNPYTNQQQFGFNMNHSDFDSIFSQIFGMRNNAQNQKQTFRTQVTISLIDAYKGSTHVLQLSTPNGNKIININVPPGIETGDSIRYDNVVDNAILIVQFVVLPDLRFDRKGSDLFSSHSISVLELIVGTKFTFTTIDERTLEVRVTPKTQPYMQLKIPKAGMPDKKGDFGNQIILLKPFMPDNISQEVINVINNSLSKTPNK
jgi:DnaJ-class molecular chaperone